MSRNPEILTVPAGAEINCGLSEDSDSVITTAPTQLLVLGPVKNGAIQVRIIDKGILSEDIYFYHQPEPKPPKR